MKIFGIGFHKTGTTSLAEALKILGYTVTGPNGVRNPNIATEVLDIAADLVARYDAFQDNPWPIIYKELDVRYPGSKFILTIRPPEDWIRSAVRHFGTTNTAMREWIYGVGHPAGHEDIYINRFNKHNRDVQEYFKDRPDDFLVMNLPAGDGWEKLCRFLGKELPDVDFPFANKAQDREKGPGVKAMVRKKVLSFGARVTRPVRRKK
ncbi:MAG: sulfotransferase family protein [Candidatus Thorarchaeota archaeon]